MRGRPEGKLPHGPRLLGTVQQGQRTGDTGQGERPAVSGVLRVLQVFQHRRSELLGERDAGALRRRVEGRGPRVGERSERVGAPVRPQSRGREAYGEAVQQVRGEQFGVLGPAAGQPSGAGPPVVPDAGVFEGGGVRTEQLNGRPHARDAEPGQIGHDDEPGVVVRLGQRPRADGELDTSRSAVHSGPYPQVLVDRGRVEHRPWHGAARGMPRGPAEHLGEHRGDGGQMLRREVEEQDAAEGRFEGGADESGQQPHGRRRPAPGDPRPAPDGRTSAAQPNSSSRAASSSGPQLSSEP